MISLAPILLFFRPVSVLFSTKIEGKFLNIKNEEDFLLEYHELEKVTGEYIGQF